MRSYEQGKTFIDAFENRLNTSVENPYLYFGVAEGDLSWDEAYANNLKKLKSRLEPFTSKGLNLKAEVIPNELHYDSYIKGLLSDFELIFPKQIWRTEYVNLIDKQDNALQNIIKFHEQLSLNYGFESHPKIESWNNQNSLDKIGYRLIRKERISEAIEVFQYITENRPSSGIAYYNMAKALEKDKQFKKALSAFEKAYNVSIESEDSKEYLKNIERLKKIIKEK